MVKIRRKTERVYKRPKQRSRAARFHDDMNRGARKWKVKQKNRAKNRVARKSRRVNRSR